MLPFCGYNMGDYFAHWLEIGAATEASKLPKLFWVNWFRRGEDGSFLWPGFGENIRVLKWIIERVEGGGEAVDTPIGRVPAPGALDTTGLDIDPAVLAGLTTVDKDRWRPELPQIEAHYEIFGDRLPHVLQDELKDFEKRLAD
jgi:phosphoenolpyruvate carboxykinase (GTP)